MLGPRQRKTTRTWTTMMTKVIRLRTSHHEMAAPRQRNARGSDVESIIRTPAAMHISTASQTISEWKTTVSPVLRRFRQRR